MTITRVPDQAPNGKVTFHAQFGKHQATGETVGAALDAITSVVDDTEGADTSGTLVLVQRFQPDRFFTAAQQARLSELVGMTERARALLEDKSK